MKIQNFDQLATSGARRALLSLAEVGLEAIDTKKVIRSVITIKGDTLSVSGREIDLKLTKQLVFVAVGKCAVDAAIVAEDILGDHLTRGVVVDVKECPPLKKIKAFKGTHPLPSDDNLHAAEVIVETLKDLTEKDVVIFVISGGGSTLLFLPPDKANKTESLIFQALTKAGATIQELNTVRKHLSLLRGGFLAKYAYPAQVVSLIFSDVPGNDMAFISSGPTVMDTTSVEDAEKVLEKFNTLRICNMEKCDFIETPKEDIYFKHVTNALVVSNDRALEAMRFAASALGFRAEIRDTRLTGEASDVAKMAAETLHGAASKSVILWGGETTVTVHGNGRGGRNLELAAAGLQFIKDDEAILSLASDGRDHGPFAGVICDTMTKRIITESGLDPEDFRRDSNVYPLFEKVGQYLMTGDTGSNVSDLIIALKS